MAYIGFKCKYTKKNAPSECRALLGGPTVETITNHDFNKSPFKDVRFCHACRKWIEITIDSLKSIPVIRALPKDTVIDFKKPEDIFAFTVVNK